MTALATATTWSCPAGELVLPASRVYTKEWYAIRQTGIGSSDLAAMYGESHWRTEYQLWREKAEGVDDYEESESMRWGKVLEDSVAREWALRAEVSLKNVGTYRSRTHPHAMANPDRLTSDGGGLEVKVFSAYARGWDHGGTPQDYIRQCEQCLAVTGRSHWWLVCLQGGQKLHIRRIDRDEKILAAHLDAEEAWWAERVERLVPPEHGAPVPLEAIQQGKAQEAGFRELVLDDVTRWRQLLSERGDVQGELDLIQERLKRELGDAELLTVDGVPMVQRVRKKAPARFNRKALKREHPEIEKKYTELGEPTEYLSLLNGGNSE